MFPFGACLGTPIASYQEVVDMAPLHRSKGCNHTADWITGYFDLGLVNLKFTVGLGSLTDWHTDFLGPDGVGNKQ